MPMSVEHRIQSLHDKHIALETAIETEEARPHPDEVELHAMKKQKLQIKDEISELSAP